MKWISFHSFSLCRNHLKGLLDSGLESISSIYQLLSKQSAYYGRFFPFQEMALQKEKSFSFPHTSLFIIDTICQISIKNMEIIFKFNFAIFCRI